MRHIIAIDPGVTGAICWMIELNRAIEVWDIPTVDIGKKGKHKNVLDLRGTEAILRGLVTLPDVVLVLEDAPLGAAMRRKPGQPVGGEENELGVSATTMARQQRLCGQIEGIVSTLGFRYEMASPQVWKRAMMPGEARDKEAARLKALQMFPNSAEAFRRKMDQNRAEAALLAEWRRRRG